MTRIMRRIYSLVLAFALVGAALGSFHQSTAHAQGGFGYMCDAWEESCDDGSGGPWNGGGGGGGDSTTVWKCPDSQKCGNFGCHAKSIADHTQVCSRYLLEGATGSCPSPVNCTH